MFLEMQRKVHIKLCPAFSARRAIDTLAGMDTGNPLMSRFGPFIHELYSHCLLLFLYTDHGRIDWMDNFNQ